MARPALRQPLAKVIGWNLFLLFLGVLGIEVVLAVFGFEPVKKPVLGSAAPGAIKVAIFGESAAVGIGSPLNFDFVLRQELQRRYPQQLFEIRTFAAIGNVFHGLQAEAAKSVMSQFDVLVLYCGNNEAFRYTDRVGYFRKPESRGLQKIPQFEQLLRLEYSSGSLTDFLGVHSRLYGTLFRTFFLHPYVDFDSTNARVVRFHEFEAEAVPPAAEAKHLEIAFAVDVEEIAALAERQGKQVLMAKPIANPEWEPFFSVRRAELSDADFTAFTTAFGAGARALKAGDRKVAQRELQKARALDSDSAIVNYRLGELAAATGDRTKAREYWHRSIETDGLPFHSRDYIATIGQAAQAKHPRNFHYVDAEAGIRQAVEAGMPYSDLFIDRVHAKLAGVLSVTGAFADKFADLPYGLPSTRSLASPSLRTQLEPYEKFAAEHIPFEEDFHRTRSQLLLVYLWAAGSPYQATRMASVHRLIGHLNEISHGNGRVEAFAGVFSALALHREDASARANATICEHLNHALAADPNYAWQCLAGHESLGKSDVEELAERGVRYSESERKFVAASR